MGAAAPDRKEAYRMSHRSSLSLAVAVLVLGATVAACGSSSATPPPAAGNPAAANPTAAVAAATPTVPVPAGAHPTTVAGDKCPSAATVGGALGITLPKPTGVAPGGTTGFPAGATAVVCEYAGKSYNVILELITNFPPSDIALFSSQFPVPFQNVSGVGDQARSFLQTLGGGKDNEGVVGTKGSNCVDIVATATPASMAQLEALVNSLL
jgi:hypothetical protein